MIRRLGRSHGDIHIRFGEPLSLAKWLGAGGAPGEEPDATTVELERDGREGVQRVLDALVASDVVSCYAGGPEAVYAIARDQHLAAASYRNTIIHFFVNGAIAELALRRTGEEGVTERVAELWDEAMRLRDLLKFELFFAEKETFRGEIRQELALHDPDWEARLALGSGAADAILRRVKPFHAHRILRPFLEAYRVVADALEHRPPGAALDGSAFLADRLASRGAHRLIPSTSEEGRMVRSGVGRGSEDDAMHAARRIARALRSALATALAALASGCADPGATVQQLGIPGSSFQWTVVGVTPRGPYLDASLRRESGVASRVFTFDTPPCRSVLTPGSAIEWRESGPAGTFVRGDESCSGAGASDLASPRRPRPMGQIAPSALATFRPLYGDEATIFLRGRFPLGYTVGWPIDQDCVAVLPNTPACRAIAATGNATLQYWPSSESVLRLMTPDPQGCPVLALLGPPPRDEGGEAAHADAARRRANAL